MLYFLAALPFSSELGELEKHIDTILSKPISVAISDAPQNSLSMTADSINSNLTTTLCLFASTMLGRFQGPGYSGDNGDPFLHNLYINGLNLKYPSSGPYLYNSLSNYLYAIQFQFNLLHHQCKSEYSDGYGWKYCRYGSMIQYTPDMSNSVPHICPVIRDCRHNLCDHKNQSPGCNHHNSTKPTCGSGTSASPLQAFLTDNLKGFTVNLPGSQGHLYDHPAGSLCHARMGFQPIDLRKDTASKGYHIFVTLHYICVSAVSPFRQFCENLLCLTKHTPRTLGEFFGFYWQFVAAMDNIYVLNAILSYVTEASGSDEEYGKALMRAISDVNGSEGTHNGVILHHATKGDLMSLYYPKCITPTCGPYLSPLIYTTGATFSPKYASTYVSWLVYLSDDFCEWLNEFLERFNSVTCNDCVQSRCGPHTPGSHASACRCFSIVECANVLPMYYEYAFTILDPRRLKSTANTKRTCANFSSALSNVVDQTNNTPLFKLLTTIDDLLYLFRMYFFYNLSTFWITYVCIVLYIYFLRADLLHLKSHVHFPSSHGIPPITLLTTGKSPSITKLTYFMRDLT